jgi:predicted nuclease of predicted toxin-antitoxin system
MKFLVDVNASDSAARWLEEHGHDVKQIKDIDPRMPDEQVLQLAVRERRIVVTTDQDFEEMIWREGRVHAGLLRLENLPRSARLTLLEDVLTRYEAELMAGVILIASSRKIRIRRA